MAAALGAVIVITVVAVIIVQMRKKRRNDFPDVDYRGQYERVPTDYAYE